MQTKYRNEFLGHEKLWIDTRITAEVLLEQGLMTLSSLGGIPSGHIGGLIRGHIGFSDKPNGHICKLPTAMNSLAMKRYG